MPKYLDHTDGSHVHPIAKLLLCSLRPSEASVYAVSPDGLTEIGIALQKLLHTSELLPAITTLIRFCRVLESRGAQDAARALLGAAKEVVPELERMTGAQASTQAAQARERFARLTGEARRFEIPVRSVDRGRATQSMLAFRAASNGGRR